MSSKKKTTTKKKVSSKKAEENAVEVEEKASEAKADEGQAKSDGPEKGTLKRNIWFKGATRKAGTKPDVSKEDLEYLEKKGLLH